MNILIVTQYFWPETFRVNDLAVSLVERGHSVTVLTGTPNYPEGKFYDGFGLFKKNYQRYSGVKVIRVPIIPRGRSGGINLILNYLSYVVSAGILGPFLCRGKFDSILAFQLSPVTIALPAIVLKKIKKIPMFLWIQDLWPETVTAVSAIKASNPLLKVLESLVRYIYGNSDRILIQSKAFRSSVIKYWNGAPEELLYLPNFAETLYQPVPLDTNAPEYKDMPPDGFRIVFAGNIGQAQDFKTILLAAEILKEHKDIHWVIIGDGRAKAWVEEKVQKKGLSAVFHLIGRHPIEKMPVYFSFADTLLVTLKKDPIFELTIPSKVQSYMACGKPIIAGLGGEGADIIEQSGSGIVCDAENPEMLVEAVLKLYHMPEVDRIQLGTSGRKYFEDNFERSLLVERLDRWMNEVVYKTYIQ